MPAFLVLVVVATEEGGCFLVDVQGFKQGKRLANLVINHLDHASESFFRERPILIFEDAEIGNAHSVAADAGFPASFIVGQRGPERGAGIPPCLFRCKRRFCAVLAHRGASQNKIKRK